MKLYIILFLLFDGEIITSVLTKESTYTQCMSFAKEQASKYPHTVKKYGCVENSLKET